MTSDDLKQFTAKQLAEFWCSLNSFEWPPELGDKPAGYGDRDDDKSGIKIMGLIERELGIKECLREWNKDRMDNDQFEAWWGNRS